MGGGRYKYENIFGVGFAIDIDTLIKIIELGYNPHNKDIDLLNKDERNIFDCGLKTAYKYAETI